jgi:hypothetical protein
MAERVKSSGLALFIFINRLLKFSQYILVGNTLMETGNLIYTQTTVYETVSKKV